MTGEQLADNSTGKVTTGETGASTGASTGESTGETTQVSEGEPNRE